MIDPGPAAIAVQDVHRQFDEVRAVAGVSFSVAKGEFVSILGPSGCGKTTLLRITAGFEMPDRGTVWVDGRDVTRQPPHLRPVNMVFQRYALFPHKTVAENVAFGPRIRGRSRREAAKKVEELLALVRLDGYGERSITQLSGGQAQRVALARALANDPTVLVLDEPLAALDRKLRQSMHFELRRIQRSLGSTFLYVTHDQEEALTMSDRIILMHDGLIEQIGPPIEVYMAPATRFVSSFIGETNLFEGEVVRCDVGGAGGYDVEVETTRVSVRAEHAERLDKGTRVWVSVRPEAMEVLPTNGSAPASHNAIRGRIAESVFLGSAVRYLISVDDQRNVIGEVSFRASTDMVVGDDVAISWPAEAARLLCS